jgi:hypothetical protein
VTVTPNKAINLTVQSSASLAVVRQVIAGVGRPRSRCEANSCAYAVMPARRSDEPTPCLNSPLPWPRRSDCRRVCRATGECCRARAEGCGDLPIEQPTQWSLVVNLKTAKALGITILESILLRADEAIRLRPDGVIR